MARKMADEILEAERNAEKIISDAEKRASEISESAKLRAEENAAGIIAAAQKSAEEITDSAKTQSELKRQEAEGQAEDIKNGLDGKYEQNIAAATAAANDIMFS